MLMAVWVNCDIGQNVETRQYYNKNGKTASQEGMQSCKIKSIIITINILFVPQYKTKQHHKLQFN